MDTFFYELVLGWAIGMRLCSPLVLVILQACNHWLRMACLIVLFIEYIYDQSYLAGDRRSVGSVFLRVVTGIIVSLFMELKVSNLISIIILATHASYHIRTFLSLNMKISPIAIGLFEDIFTVISLVTTFSSTERIFFVR